MNQLMDASAIQRSIRRLCHEIIERNRGIENIILVGIKTRGITLAHRMHDLLLEFEGIDVPVYDLDISYWRDDIKKNPNKPDIHLEVDNKICILVDDVLFGGRTIRAAMDGIMDFGRPLAIQLAVLVDRGHRELPIRPDYVGKNLPTSHTERVFVNFVEDDGIDSVQIDKQEESR